MSRRNPIDWKDVAKQKKLLEKAGFRVVEKAEVHWHVFKSGFWQIVNVWPSAYKMMQVGGNKSEMYGDIVKEIEQFYLKDSDAEQAYETTQKARALFTEPISEV